MAVCPRLAINVSAYFFDLAVDLFHLYLKITQSDYSLLLNETRQCVKSAL